MASRGFPLKKRRQMCVKTGAIQTPGSSKSGPDAVFAPPCDPLAPSLRVRERRSVKQRRCVSAEGVAPRLRLRPVNTSP